MSDPLRYPKLRWPIDIRIEKLEKEDVLVINCPLGVAPSPLVLVSAVAPILGQFEGTLSLEEITQKFTSYGVTQALVQELVGLLDKHLFLQGPRYFAAEQAVRENFIKAPIRPAALAGLSYPMQEIELQRLLDGYLANGNGAALKPDKKLVCLVSPHIDYRRGGICYGISYARLKPERHDLYILIGTSHQYSQHMFHLTSKDFASPNGTLACDKQFVQKLADRYGKVRSFADELLHRREHSLELQVPFLNQVTQGSTMVPILVGGFNHMLRSGKLPHEFDEYEQFAGSLAEGVKERIAQGHSVCFVAGVDMAHMGKHFGDETELSPEKLREIESRDRRYLDAISQQDKLALFSHIAEDSDARRICGFPTMYTIIDVLDRLGISYQAELYDYRQAYDSRTDCAVTFAGMGLYS